MRIYFTRASSIQFQRQDTCYLTTRDCLPRVNFVLGSWWDIMPPPPQSFEGRRWRTIPTRSPRREQSSSITEVADAQVALHYLLHVPCHVSNVRRMSPRRASVRPKAFKYMHPRTSLVCFVCAAYGSVRRRRSEERLRRRGARCDVRLNTHHTRSIRSSAIYVHRHHPRLSLVGELRAACLVPDQQVHSTHPAPRGASDVWRSTEHEVHSRSNGLYVSRGCILALYTCVSEYRTCVSSHRVERHRSVPSTEQKKPKKKQSRKSRRRCIVVASEKP